MVFWESESGVQELAPACRRTPNGNKGVSMQDLINRLNSADELTRQLMVRL